MAEIEQGEYVRAIVRYVERIADDLGLLRGMLKILEDDGFDKGNLACDRPAGLDQENRGADGQGHDGQTQQ